MIAALFLALACARCAPPPPPEPLTVACTATDGDTIRCGEERIRLTGIDAPELPGHCRKGRACAPGDPQAARRALAAALASGPLTIRRTGHDRYGRTLAAIAAAGEDIACRQLAAGAAVYIRKWDDRRMVAAACPALAAAGAAAGV